MDCALVLLACVICTIFPYMNRGCLPELGAGTQPYSSLSEWDYILYKYMLEITNLFLDFTSYESKDCLECQKGHWTFVLFGLL